MAFDYLAQPMTQPDGAQQQYTPEQFQQWYQQQYGGAPDANMMNQIGQAVGAPGENGLYSQAQWNQGQQIANQNAAPFFPTFEAPQMEAGPAFEAPQPFQYDSFQAPTMEQAQQDPGYQFALQQGLGAMQGAQAARGLARTGGAMKGLIDYGQQAAQTQYQNVFDRSRQTYGMNRDNAAQNYAQNYSNSRDAWQMNQQQREGTFDRNYRGASDAFNSRFRGRELQFSDLYNRWNTNVNVNAQMALAD